MTDVVRHRRIALLLAVIAVAVRIAAGEIAIAQGRAFLPDSELYWGYAESLAQHGTFQVGGVGARRTPGYPLFIAACTRTCGLGDPVVPPPKSQLRAVIFAQAILGGLIAATTWSVANRLIGDDPAFNGTAAIAGLSAAIDPFAIAIAAWVLSETLFTAALMAVIWLATSTRIGIGRSVLIGAMAGVAVLARPSGLLLAPFGLILVGRRWGMAKSMTAVVAFTVLLSPWIFRNWRLYDRFVPTTLNVGESLYDGWNPNAGGGSDMKFVDRRKEIHGPPNGPADEIAEDAFWKSEATEWAKENPKRVLELAAIKLWRFWSPWPNAAEFQSPLIVVGCTAFSIIIYGGAILSVVALTRRGRWSAIAVGLIPAAYFALLHAVFVSSVRYRVPAMPMLEVLTGAGIAWVVNRRARSSGEA